MKKTTVIFGSVLLALILAGLLFFVIIPNAQYGEVRQMKIGNVDLSALSDGVYRGEYSYSSTAYEVEVSVEGHKITGIDVLRGGSNEHAKAAEGVVDSIIRAQRIDVDVISGATTSSKAILKAVENALKER